MQIVDDLAVIEADRFLVGKTITYAVTAGIGAIEAPRVIRQLRRYGADVRVSVTPSSGEVLASRALHWASGNPVVDQLSGYSEHLDLGDAMVIAPATHNTISKIGSGISDNPVTLQAAAALGRKIPLFLLPSMHDSMSNNPILLGHLESLKKLGVIILAAREEEGKQKMPGPEQIVDQITHRLGDRLRDRRVLLNGGRTVAPIDAVRLITNRSSGRTAVAIARHLYLLGAEVDLVLGPAEVRPPGGVHVVDVETPDEMKEAMKRCFSSHAADGVIFVAAVLDFVPANERAGKTPSGDSMEVELVPSPKIIRDLRQLTAAAVRVSFKLEVDLDRDALIKKARLSLLQNETSMVVANLLADKDEPRSALLVTADQVTEVTGLDTLSEGIASHLEASWS